jgi:hypothetical protein
MSADTSAHARPLSPEGQIMNADHERALLARARALADIEDLAEEVTGILGGARAARVDPDALPGLTAAALALGAGSLSVYQAEAARFDSDGEFAAAIEEADAAITGHAAAAARLRGEAGTALDAARDDLEAARDDLAAARAMAVSHPCGGCHDEKAAATAAAHAGITEARSRAACAEAAAGILAALTLRLRRALACLRRVMTDLAETYEPVYDLRHRGHAMPKDGDWLQGDGPRITGETAGR